MEKKPNLRERKKALTRKAIVEAATELFLQKGFEKTTVDEIAEKAVVSRRTFFRYFLTKDAVVFPHQQERIDKFRSLLKKFRKDNGPLRALRLATREMARAFMEVRDELNKQQIIMRGAPQLIARQMDYDLVWETVIFDMFRKAGDGSEDAVFRARTMAGAVFGVIRATLRDWYAADCEGDLVTIGTKSMDLIEEGFGDHTLIRSSDRKGKKA